MQEVLGIQSKAKAKGVCARVLNREGTVRMEVERKAEQITEGAVY